MLFAILKLSFESTSILIGFEAFAVGSIITPISCIMSLIRPVCELSRTIKGVIFETPSIKGSIGINKDPIDARGYPFLKASFVIDSVLAINFTRAVGAALVPFSFIIATRHGG